MNIYVGNVPYAATEKDLEELFSEYGPVATATIIRDRQDGRSKGFGFVEMGNQEDGERAIETLNGQKMMGRPLKVNKARPRGKRGKSQQYTGSQETTSQEPDNSPDRTFYNPYTFVPSPPRPLDCMAPGDFAGDFNPLGEGHNLCHSFLKDDLWTGYIPIQLTTVTPLVLLKGNGRKEDSTEEPYDVYNHIPESSLRGMLRSAYEVVTNSRFGCFRNDEQLAYRMGREKKKYPNSPEDLLDCSLKPAKELNELSPTDRLFGWVPQNQAQEQEQEVIGGYKSRIRVICDNEVISDIQDFSINPLPLAILGKPKPAQGRFYVAKDNQGTPQEDGLNKEEAGYSKGKGLRGRKHYWHYKGKTEDYWVPSPENQNQEYIRAGRIKDSQNRSIKGWIKPNKEFTTSLYVQNLQPQEVGALLWLLSLPDKHYFRLGYGKPLGFGSVRIEIDEDQLVNGCLPLGTSKDWKTYYKTFNDCPPATLDNDKQDDYLKMFKESMADAYNPPEESNISDDSDAENRFDDLPFISAFLQVLQGPVGDAPIHYPRLDSKPQLKGENFRWFTANDNGRKLALPSVKGKNGLPYKP